MSFALTFMLYRKTVYERYWPYTGIEKTCPNSNSSYKITGWTHMEVGKNMFRFF